MAHWKTKPSALPYRPRMRLYFVSIFGGIVKVPSCRACPGWRNGFQCPLAHEGRTRNIDRCPQVVGETRGFIVRPHVEDVEPTAEIHALINTEPPLPEGDSERESQPS